MEALRLRRARDEAIDLENDDFASSSMEDQGGSGRAERARPSPRNLVGEARASEEQTQERQDLLKRCLAKLHLQSREVASGFHSHER